MNSYAKFKIAYLLLVILFSLGVLTYLLDRWGVIRLEEYIPYLISEAPLAPDDDSISELDREALEKERERLKEEELRLLALQTELEQREQILIDREEELAEREKGLKEERSKLEEEQKLRADRARMITEMANRLNAMPPDDAVAIVEGWSNTELVDVFLQMERNAEEQGAPSIVPFLITKLPRERAALITTLMMDAEALLLPES